MAKQRTDKQTTLCILRDVYWKYDDGDDNDGDGDGTYVHTLSDGCAKVPRLLFFDEGAVLVKENRQEVLKRNTRQGIRRSVADRIS